MEKGVSRRKILQDYTLRKKTLKGWISQKEELLQAAGDAIKFGKRIKGKCRLAPGSFKRKYGQLDATMMVRWTKRKRVEEQADMKPWLLHNIRQEAARLCLPNSFNATDWMDLIR